MKNNYKYGQDCYYQHIQLVEGQIFCYNCGEICENKMSLVTHIKNNHGMTICKNFLRGSCTFDSEECFYKHEVVWEDNNDAFLENNPTPIIPPEQEQNRTRPTEKENTIRKVSGLMMKVGMQFMDIFQVLILFHILKLSKNDRGLMYYLIFLILL